MSGDLIAALKSGWRPPIMQAMEVIGTLVDALEAAEADDYIRVMVQRVDEAEGEADAWKARAEAAEARLGAQAQGAAIAGAEDRATLLGALRSAEARLELAWREGYYTGKSDYAASIMGGGSIRTPNPYALGNGSET